MKKAVKIILIVLVVAAVGIFAMRTWTKSHSPEETVAFSKNGLEIKVDYCRPYKKERVVFGGIVPYGEVWRTGANEATVIELNQDVKIEDKALKAGKYSLWTVPSEDNWTIIFNAETGQWGTSYDEAEDVLKVEVPSEIVSDEVEQFKMQFEEAVDGADLVLRWENTMVVVPFRK